MSQDTLTDRIYEAAFNPDEWVTVLDGLGAVSSASGGCVTIINGNVPLGARHSEIIRDLGEDAARNPPQETIARLMYAYANPTPGFVASSAYYPKPLLDADPFLHRKIARGLGDEAFTLIPLPSGETAMFSIDRPIARGAYCLAEIELLNRLHPHLARASLVSARLRLERAQATVSMLEALGIPAAVLGELGRVRASNALLDSVSTRLKPAAFGGITIANPAANKLFREAVTLSMTAHDGFVRSIPVPAFEDAPALVVHVLPLRRSAYDIFSGADILVAATLVNAGGAAPSPGILTGLFDLTPAEVKLASALTEGHSLRVAAQNCGIQFSTARSYLERIFRKTGTHQQSQLVALLKSAQPLRPN